jgi:hypothetical protein
MNHIAENIVFKNRNISFLAINTLFRQRETHTVSDSKLGNNHFIIEDYVPLQINDRLRVKAEKMTVVFELDKHNNIIVKTAYSENDSIE